ncbi:unnamed protein product [Chrysoparadoxa australica]
MQVCTGPVSGTTMPCPWPLEGNLGERITFIHKPIVSASSPPEETRLSPSMPLEAGEITKHLPSYGIIDVLTEPGNAEADAMLVQCLGSGAQLERADDGTLTTATGSSQTGSTGINALLGPVLGKIKVIARQGMDRESCTVPVLLETDGAGTVACTATDVLTRERFQVEQEMKPRTPRAFWLQGLRSSRRYLVEFEGISNRDTRKGRITTPNSNFPDLVMAVVSGDIPGELPDKESNPWATLADRLDKPWHGVECILHVGGQVQFESAFQDGLSHLQGLEERLQAGMVTAEEEQEELHAVKERFREDLRKVWNQPSTRAVLASCSNIMPQMWGRAEVCQANRTSKIGRRLLRLARDVYREYHRQLWDSRWGKRYELASHEAFLSTMRFGAVGILCLDTRELIPERGPVYWGETAFSEEDKPFIGEGQWKLLQKALEEDQLTTLIVVSELPLLWDDSARSDEEKNSAPSNSWSHRPKQQCNLLQCLFDWKHALEGREVQLVSGVGPGVGCSCKTIVQAKLEVKSSPVDEGEPPQNKGEQPPKGSGKRDKQKSDQEEEPEVKLKKVVISQVVSGPMTANPSEIKIALKGKVAHPEVTSVFDFAHTSFPGRGYVLLQVIADRDEEGIIGVTEARVVTCNEAATAHSVREFTYPPLWWAARCIGGSVLLLDDDVYLKGREYTSTTECRRWLEDAENLKEVTSLAYGERYLADASRPPELRSISIGKPDILKKQLREAVKQVYWSMPDSIRKDMAYIPDPMIYNFLLLKACPQVVAAAVDDLSKFCDICTTLFVDAAYIKAAAVWAEEDDQKVIIEEYSKQAVVEREMRKQQRQLEADMAAAEGNAAEMQRLMADNPEEYQRRMVEKRTLDADRRKREEMKKNEEERAEKERQKAIEAQSVEDAARLKAEAKAKEEREQKELNDLAETDPDEYDRRIKIWHSRKLEEAARGDKGDGGSSLDRRRKLAIERRDKRRRELLRS